METIKTLLSSNIRRVRTNSEDGTREIQLRGYTLDTKQLAAMCACPDFVGLYADNDDVILIFMPANS